MREWRRYSIRQLVGAPISGKRPTGGVNTEPEGIPSLGGENIRADGGMDYGTINRVPAKFFQSMPKGRLQENDVLINKDGAQTGKVGIYDGRFAEAAVNEHVFILRSSNGTIDQRLLYYYLLLAETQSKIARRITGSAQPGLNSQFVDAVHLAFPTDRDEQHWIAEVLATVDETIEQTEALIAKTQKIRAGLMHGLFTRGVTADGQLRPVREEAPQLYKESPLGWIPKEWSCESFDQLLSKGVLSDIQDGNHGEQHPKRDDFVPEGIPFLMAKDLAGGEIDFKNCFRITSAQYRSLRIGFAKEDDVLLSHKGTIGETALVPNGHPDVMLTPQVTYYRVGSAKLLPYFLLSWMRSSIFQRRLKLLAAQSTRDYVGITEQKRSLYALLPMPAEQEQIAAISGASAEKLQGEHFHAAKLRQVKAGIMHALLTGRVRVPVADAHEVAANV